MKRVVITGIGIVSPFGMGTSTMWKGVTAGKSVIRNITKFDITEYSCKIAGEVPNAGEPNGFNPDDWIDKKEQKKMGRFIQYGMAASQEAIIHAGLTDASDEMKERIGVMLGSGIGGFPEIENTFEILLNRGPRRVSPFFIPSFLINLLPGQVSIKHGFQGPNVSVTTACATGAHAIGEAMHIIKRGEADIMLAGGAEAAICRLAVSGFASAKALSTGYNDDPAKSSRPFDEARDGFVMGEGAAVLILEDYEHAKKRGVEIIAEVAGFGQSGDAHHITSPREDGKGCKKAVKMALNGANANVNDVQYVNAHATSTPAGDVIESKAMQDLFGAKIVMSSTKSMTGHMLGAAGAIETAICALALKHQIVPPTINLENPSEGCVLDYVPNTAREMKLDVVLNNSFGFGGTNAALILKKI
jgi:3-oxoacyl-[acyl-carrier-protein] synthase II